jgi:hypothetical protein
VDQQSDQANQYVERINMLGVVAGTEAGIGFLQWLCRITGFNRPIMSLEDASRRDIWLTLRQYIPVEKLSEIEHFDLRKEQKMQREMMEALAEIQEGQEHE